MGVASAMPRPLYPQERDPLPIVQEAGRAPGLVWTGSEKTLPGFDPRTVQTVARRCTNCAVPADDTHKTAPKKSHYIMKLFYLQYEILTSSIEMCNFRVFGVLVTPKNTKYLCNLFFFKMMRLIIEAAVLILCLSQVKSL